MAHAHAAPSPGPAPTGPSNHGGHVDGFGTTLRTDNWWLGPTLTFLGFSGWLVYFFWAAAQGRYYSAGPYMSPFYLFYSHPANPADASAANALFGFWPSAWPAFFSPALIVGFLPGSFRVTCYYYRKAYYRAFFGLPPGCAVGTRQMDYRGETMLLLWQNAHRYTVYLAIALLPFLFFEAGKAFFHHGSPGFGIGSLLLVGNAILLSSYTLGCHAWRHLVGGKLNCFSCDGVSEARHGAWRFTTWLNERHMLFAWLSLYWILFTDVYIRLVSMGVIPDVNTWGGLTMVGDF